MHILKMYPAMLIPVSPVPPLSAADGLHGASHCRSLLLHTRLCAFRTIGSKSVEKARCISLCTGSLRLTRTLCSIDDQSPPPASRDAWHGPLTGRPPDQKDVAYCLMGLFSVNMPMLYGECEKAFLRLQEEIMKQSDDQSIFAWTDPDASRDSLHGLLAPSPAMFAGCANILPYQDWEPRQPYTMTNRGLQIELPLMKEDDDIYVAVLNCPSPPDYKTFSFLAVTFGVSHL